MKLHWADKIKVGAHARQCARCKLKFPRGTLVWREVWTDIGHGAGPELDLDYVCLRCPGEDESRLIERRALVAYLNDPESG